MLPVYQTFIDGHLQALAQGEALKTSCISQSVYCIFGSAAFLIALSSKASLDFIQIL